MTLKKTIGALAAMLALGRATAKTHVAAKNQTQMVAPKRQLGVGVDVNDTIGNDGQPNPRKHIWGNRNQRQYRKLTRQCPWLRNSKNKRINPRKK